MESIDLWRLNSSLTVVEAAYLILGVDPTPHIDSINGWRPDQPSEYPAVFKALRNDILSHLLTANFKARTAPTDGAGDGIDWNEIRVSVGDLKSWLSEKNMFPVFFFPDGPLPEAYLDPSDECFSPKLAAAIKAWKAVRDQRKAKHSKGSVKTDLIEWLESHSKECDLRTKDGKLNNLAIQEIAKVANWRPEGGAPKTPGN